MINTFSYIKTSCNTLFAAHHPANKIKEKKRTVVICSPIGPEYIKTYRVIRLLADQIASHGYNVLRFDWSSHGDSSGDEIEGSLENWHNDLVTVTNYFRERTSEPVSFVCIRLSCLLFIKSASNLGTIENCIFWDPVINGSDWITEVSDFHRQLFPDTQINHDRYFEILGFPFNCQVYSDINSLQISNYDLNNVEQIDIVCQDTNKFNNVNIRSSVKANLHTVPLSGILTQPKYFDRIMMSSPANQKIITLLNKNKNE
jgi:hypothetical protein